MENNEVVMPEFNFTGEFDMGLDEAVEAAASGPSFLTPGQYAVKITDAIAKGVNTHDNKWANVQLVLTAANDRSTKSTLVFPITNTLKFNGGKKETTFPTLQLKDFFNAAGVVVTNTTELVKAITKYLKDPMKLVGRELTVDIGYRRPFVDYAGKSDDGESVFVIKKADGTLHPKFMDGGESTRYTSREEAKEAAEAVSVALDGFPGVTKYVQRKKGSL